MSNVPQTEVEVRAQSIENLRALGVDPYGVSFTSTIRSTDVHNLCEAYAEDLADPLRPIGRMPREIAGRITSKRVMGKMSFIDILDDCGPVQIVLSRDDLPEGFYNDVFKKNIQIGDIIGVEGVLYITQKGEASIKASKIHLLGKSSRPIPFPKVADGETHYEVKDLDYLQRNRYIDLLTNPASMKMVQDRASILRSIRNTMYDARYTEVETPMLQPVYGGAHARPFTTHHNALDQDMFLRVAPELYLKRLMVGGFRGVYEIGKNFRNEGVDRTHNPEFTMLELYVAYKDAEWLMDFTEKLIDECIVSVTSENSNDEWNRAVYAGLDANVSRDGYNIRRNPYRRLHFLAALNFRIGAAFETIVRKDDVERVKTYIHEQTKAHIEGDSMADVLDAAFSQFIGPTLTTPTFVTSFPTCLSPLAKQTVGDPFTTQRFELYIGGNEIANGFTELNDPVEQRARFEEQDRAYGDGIDEDYIYALEHGLPFCVGLGIGIDRLVMAITGAESIRDVIAFPTLRTLPTPVKLVNVQE